MAGGVGTAAVIPVKSLSAAKSRLARELTQGDRAAVSLDMLRSVLAQVRQTPGIGAWAVVSRDERALQCATDLGGTAIPETMLPASTWLRPGEDSSPGPAATGLNAALELGRQWSVRLDAAALLIVPSDLPLVRSADLAELLRLSEEDNLGVLVAPSNDGGTNALLLRPPDAIPFRFGPGSAERHLTEAGERGLRTRVVHRRTLAFDVDTPDDFSCYLAVEEGLAQLHEAQTLASR